MSRGQQTRLWIHTALSLSRGACLELAPEASCHLVVSITGRDGQTRLLATAVGYLVSVSGRQRHRSGSRWHRAMTRRAPAATCPLHLGTSSCPLAPTTSRWVGKEGPESCPLPMTGGSYERQSTRVTGLYICIAGSLFHCGPPGRLPSAAAGSGGGSCSSTGGAAQPAGSCLPRPGGAPCPSSSSSSSDGVLGFIALL